MLFLTSVRRKELNEILMELTTLFCLIDDFCADFEAEYYKHLMDDGKIKRVWKSRLSLSEVMTIIIQFQRSGYRTFKHYYQRPVSVYLRWAFPQLVSYHRLWNWWLRPWYLYLPIFGAEKANAPAFLLSTPGRLPSVIVEEFPPILSGLKRLNGVRTRLVLWFQTSSHR